MIEVDATTLYASLLENPIDWNLRYLGRTLQVRGGIGRILWVNTSEGIVTLRTTSWPVRDPIHCHVSPAALLAPLRPEQLLMVRGICDNFDGSSINLTHCQIVPTAEQEKVNAPYLP